MFLVGSVGRCLGGMVLLVRILGRTVVLVGLFVVPSDFLRFASHLLGVSFFLLGLCR